MAKRINVLRLYEQYARSRARQNHAPTSAHAELGAYCVWLLEKFGGADFEDDEGQWAQLWQNLGISGGDGADIVATTFSKTLHW